MKIGSTMAGRWIRGIGALVIGGALALTVSAPAHAETLNGSCETGELCLHYYTNQGGPIADMYDDVADYSGWHFAASSLWLDNNTESGHNAAMWNCAWVSQSPNYTGFTVIFQTESYIDDFYFAGYYNFRNAASSHQFKWSCS